MMMTRISDETLVAYVDGELAPEQAAEVELALRTDRQARDTVRMFRETAECSRNAYDDILREPVPGRLIRTVTGAARGTTGRAARSGRIPDAAWSERRGLAALAMAASIALAIGVGGGFGLSSLLHDIDDGQIGAIAVGAVDARGPLRRALETMPSGTLTANGTGSDVLEVMPLTTFIDRAGRYCRDFQTSTTGPAGRQAASGIACRSPAGQWRVEAVLAAPTQTASDRFVTASGAEDDPLRTLLDTLAATGPLSLADESALLEKGWK